MGQTSVTYRFDCSDVPDQMQSVIEDFRGWSGVVVDEGEDYFIGIWNIPGHPRKLMSIPAGCKCRKA